MLSSEESSSDLVLQVCNEIHTKGVFQALILDLDKIGFEVSLFLLVKLIWFCSRSTYKNISNHGN